MANTKTGKNNKGIKLRGGSGDNNRTSDDGVKVAEMKRLIPRIQHTTFDFSQISLPCVTLSVNDPI